MLLVSCPRRLWMGGVGWLDRVAWPWMGWDGPPGGVAGCGYGGHEVRHWGWVVGGARPPPTHPTCSPARRPRAWAWPCPRRKEAEQSAASAQTEVQVLESKVQRSWGYCKLCVISITIESIPPFPHFYDHRIPLPRWLPQTFCFPLTVPGNICIHGWARSCKYPTHGPLSMHDPCTVPCGICTRWVGGQQPTTEVQVLESKVRRSWGPKFSI